MPPRRSTRKKAKVNYNEDLDETALDSATVNQAVGTVTTESSSSGSLKKTTRKTSRSKAGKLSELTSMPLDILYEIFSHLQPYDLLRLARLNKDLRRLLMSRQSIGVWRSAWEHSSPKLPEPFKGMSEPAFVNLAYDPHCHICLAPNVRSAEWKWKMRLCKSCRSAKTIACSGLKKTPYKKWESVVPDFPYLVHRALPACFRGERNVEQFLAEDVEKLGQRLQAMGAEEREVYITSREDERLEVIEQAALCSAWSRAQQELREIELEEIRRQRKEAIYDKLRELGWGDVIDELPEELKEMFEDLKEVRQPKLLTNQIWNHIKETVEEFMSLAKSAQDEAKRRVLVVQRMNPAFIALNAHKRAQLPTTDLMPEMSDFCNFPQVKRLLELPETEDVSLTQFKEALADSEQQGHFADFRKRCREAIERKVRTYEEYYDFEPDKPELARYVFQCKLCSGQPEKGLHWNEEDCADSDDDHDDDPFWHEDIFDGMYRSSTLPHFYPEVLHHRCLTRTRKRDEDSTLINPSKTLVNLGEVGDLGDRTQWSTENLYLDDYLGCVMENMTRVAGLDPDTATAKDMDRVGMFFMCLHCELKDKENVDWSKTHGKLMSWRAALAHASAFHSPSAMYDTLDDIDWMTLPYSNASTLFVSKHSKTVSVQDEKVFQCAHCMDSVFERLPRTMSANLRHLRKDHNTKEPEANVDYFERPGTAPAFTRMDIELSLLDSSTSEVFEKMVKMPWPSDDEESDEEDESSDDAMDE